MHPSTTAEASSQAYFREYQPRGEALRLIQELRAELRDEIRRDEVALAADQAAIVLPAPSAKGYVTERTTFYDDIGLTHRAGPVRRSYTFHREPSKYGYHPAAVWSAEEYRKDLWGNEWSRSLHGYFVMDDFGTLVPLGGAA